MTQNFQSSQKKFIAYGRFSYCNQDLLGKGATGNVYEGYDHKDNKIVAIKVVQTGKMNQIEKNLIENQKKALKMIKHPNIMKMIHVQDQNQLTFIISEIYEGGCLKSYLQNKGNFKQDQALQFFRKIVNAYCSIAEANIIHRDLKPANILLTKQGEPVIIDFGYSQIIIANRNLTVFNVGSPSYMSPQAFKKTIFSQKSDVWSLGIIFYQMLTGFTLDQGINIKLHFQILEKTQCPIMQLDAFKQVSKQILKGCLSILPQNRITAHRMKYLLDKQILGKKFGVKNIIKTQLNGKKDETSFHSANIGIQKVQFLKKNIDCKKVRQEQLTQRRQKIGGSKTFTNFYSASDSSNETFNKKINQSVYNEPLREPQSFKKTATINEADVKIQNQQRNSVKNIDCNSTNASSSMSRVNYNPARTQEQKNSISSLNYGQKINLISNLNLKNTNSFSRNDIKDQQRNIGDSKKEFNSTFNYESTKKNQNYNNQDYYNVSMKDAKSLTYNQGFFKRALQQNDYVPRKSIKNFSQFTNIKFFSQVKTNNFSNSTKNLQISIPVKNSHQRTNTNLQQKNIPSSNVNNPYTYYQQQMINNKIFTSYNSYENNSNRNIHSDNINNQYRNSDKNNCHSQLNIGVNHNQTNSLKDQNVDFKAKFQNFIQPIDFTSQKVIQIGQKQLYRQKNGLKQINITNPSCERIYQSKAENNSYQNNQKLHIKSFLSQARASYPYLPVQNYASVNDNICATINKNIPNNNESSKQIQSNQTQWDKFHNQNKYNQIYPNKNQYSNVRTYQTPNYQRQISQQQFYENHNQPGYNQVNSGCMNSNNNSSKKIISLRKLV